MSPASRLVAVGGLLQVLACAPPDGSMIGIPGGRHEAAARQRTSTELENLQAFAHMYGHIRFFHPTDAAAAAGWRELAAQGAAEVREADTLGELAVRLDDVFRPLAPSMQLWVHGEAPPELPAAPPRAAAVYWQYEGFPGTPVSLYRPPYDRVRVGAGDRALRRFTEAPSSDTRVEDEPVPDLEVRIPVVLDPEQARGASIDAQIENLDPWLAARALARDGYTSLDVRQGAVIEVWNVLRHFYPYQEAVASDWDAILMEALVDAEDDVTRQDMSETLRRLVHAIQDGHGEVGHRWASRGDALPFRLELVEDQAVITATSEPDRFAVGDVVERLGDESALDRIRRLESLVSGSEHWRRFKAATWEAPRGPSDASVQVTLRGTNGVRDVSARYVHDEPLPPARPPAIHRHEDGVFYVDLTRAQWSEIEARLEDIAAAPGVVFDLRGYPNDNDAIIDHLLDAPEDALWMHVPRILEPGGKITSWRDIGWHRRPREPSIAGRVAFLTSAGAISYAESILGYVEAHDLGTLVGAPSAGTNGDIVRFDTLAGFYVIFTGMRVTHHDGRPLHLRGIEPDLLVEPTLAGLRAGRDEVLDAGLAVARADKRSPDSKIPD